MTKRCRGRKTREERCNYTMRRPRIDSLLRRLRKMGPQRLTMKRGTRIWTKDKET
jgi:hypothetical protein